MSHGNRYLHDKVTAMTGSHSSCGGAQSAEASASAANSAAETAATASKLRPIDELWKSDDEDPL